VRTRRESISPDVISREAISPEAISNVG